MFDAIDIKDVKVELGKLIKVLRKSRKLSQAALAKRLDVSRTTIQNLELGKNSTNDTLFKVLKELNQLNKLYDSINAYKTQVTNTKPLY